MIFLTFDKLIHHSLKNPIWIMLLFSLLMSCGRRDDASQTSRNDTIAQMKKNDVPLERPQPGEWLFEHPEPGQNFEEYLKYDPVRPTETRNKIYLQPIGSFNDIQEKVLRFDAEYLAIFFNLHVELLPAISDTVIAKNARRIHYGVEQFLTTFILDYLQERIPEDGIVIMAITTNDLYPSDEWNFVFGQARIKQRVGVSSIHRLSEETLSQQNYPRCLERLIRTSSHEIGHMFSCLHCTNAVCVMNGSNSLQESDRRPNRLCSECLHKFDWNLNFNLAKRNQSLLAFFQQHDLQVDEFCAEKDEDVISQRK